MTYLQDRKQAKNKILIAVATLAALTLLFYLRPSLSSFAVSIFKPVLELGGKIKGTITGGETEIERLALALAESEAKMENYNELLAENEKLKEILDRKPDSLDLVLGVILAKPNQSAYDTLLIDVGADHGIQTGNLVFALGNIPIGKIAEVFNATSKVILFSNPGAKMDVVLSGIGTHNEIIGRGGGNFEMILPRDLTIEENGVVTLPGITPYIVAKIETTISDPRDAFTKILLTSPVNLFELKFVGVRR